MVLLLTLELSVKISTDSLEGIEVVILGDMDASEQDAILSSNDILTEV